MKTKRIVSTLIYVLLIAAILLAGCSSANTGGWQPANRCASRW